MWGGGSHDSTASRGSSDGHHQHQHQRDSKIVYPKRKLVHFPIEYSSASNTDEGTSHCRADDLLQSSDAKRRRYMRRGSKSSSMMLNAMIHLSTHTSHNGKPSSDAAMMNVASSDLPGAYDKYSYPHPSPRRPVAQLPKSPGSLFSTKQSVDKSALVLLTHALTLTSSPKGIVNDDVVEIQKQDLATTFKC